jgi:hypothetical protein
LAALRDAAGQYFGSDSVEIANLQYREAMVLPDSGERIVQSILTPMDESTAEFRFASTSANGADDWRTHMVGVARKESPARNGQAAPLELDRVRQRCASSIPVDRYYETLHALGLEYGASFRGIEMLQRGSGEVLTRVRLPAHLSVDGQSGLHPALLDACLHLYPALVDAYGDFTEAANEPRRTYLPISVERFRCAAGVRAREVWVHGTYRQPGNGNSEIFTADIAIYQDDGRFAAAIEGLSLKPLPPEALRPHVTTEANSLVQAAKAGPRIRAERHGPDTAAISSQLREASGTERRELLVDIGHHRNDRCGPRARRVGARFADVGHASEPAGSSPRLKISAVKLIQGPSVEQFVDDILAELPAADDEPRPQPIMLQPEHSAENWPITVGSPADGTTVRPPTVAQPECSASIWPIAADPMAGDEARQRPISVQSERSASKWLINVGPRAAPRLPLFCFPFAGGGSAVAVQAARGATATIPVENLVRPGGNITGFTNFDGSIGGKWLQLLKEVAPHITRVAIIYNPQTAPFASSFLRSVESAAPILAVETIAASVQNDADIESSLTAFARTTGGGLIAIPDSFTVEHRDQIISQAANNRLPALYANRAFTLAGGLMSYAVDTRGLFQRSTTYVDRILNGARPSELPVQQPTKFDLVINLKTAKALGLEVPPMLVARADEVIE